MANDLTPRNSSFFDMSPLSFFDGFKTNMVKTDIRELDDKYLIEAEIPGIPKENISVHYENGVLSITGQYRSDTKKEDEKGKVIRSERSFTDISRQFAIANVKEQEIHAAYQDGILTITLPKDEEQKKNNSIPIE